MCLINDILHILFHLRVLLSNHCSHSFKFTLKSFRKVINFLFNDIFLINICWSKRWWLLLICYFCPIHIIFKCWKLSFIFSRFSDLRNLFFDNFPLIHKLLVLHLSSFYLFLGLIFLKFLSQCKFHSVLSQFLFIVLLFQYFFLFLFLFSYFFLFNLFLEYPL